MLSTTRRVAGNQLVSDYSVDILAAGSRMTGEYIYVVLGASYLWPWNCIITASVLADSRLGENPHLNAVYSSTMMSTSTLVSLAVSLLLAARPFDYRWRVKHGLLMIIGSFAVAGVGSMLLSGTAWFVLIVCIVAASSVGTALTQNGTMAIAQTIPGGRHALANMNGQAIAGVLPPIIALLTNTSQRLQTMAALVNFGLAVLIALTALLLFDSPTNQPLVALVEEEVSEEMREESGLPPFETLKEMVTKQMSRPVIAIFLGFVVSLSYPVFANRVHSDKILWSVFNPLSHLAWNMGDLSGRLMCTRPGLRVHGTQLVTYATVRVIYVVVLVVIARFDNPADIFYLLGLYFYGLTSGHLISSAIAYIPKVVDERWLPASDGIISLVIVIGLVAGSLASFAVVLLIP